MIRPECFVLVTEPNKADIANRVNTTFFGGWQWQAQEGTKTSYSKGNFNQVLAKKKKKERKKKKKKKTPKHKKPTL